MKKFFSYGLTLLFGAGCALAISYYWEDIAALQAPPIQQTEEIAEADKEHQHSEEEHHHEENIVKRSCKRS
jgi:ABC-type nickel/cobalt efflux system permease component RcnA